MSYVAYLIEAVIIDLFGHLGQERYIGMHRANHA